MRKAAPPRLRKREDRLEILLPLVAPTSKIRLKRFNKAKLIGEPVSARSRPISPEDYLEWQISYFCTPSDNCIEPSLLLPEISFHGERSKGMVAYELPKIIYEAALLGIITRDEVNALLKFVESVSPEDTLEENFAPERSRLNGSLKGGFVPYLEKTYAFVKRDPHGGHWVEIVLKHKQKAIGFQSMVYLCISVSQLLSDLDGGTIIGRPAHKGEYTYLVVDGSNVGIFLDAARAFGLASLKHKEDILKILRGLQKLL